MCLGALWRVEARREPWCVVVDLYIWDSLSPLGSPPAGLGHWTHGLQMMQDDTAVETRSLSMSRIHTFVRARTHTHTQSQLVVGAQTNNRAEF